MKVPCVALAALLSCGYNESSIPSADAKALCANWCNDYQRCALQEACSASVCSNPSGIEDCVKWGRDVADRLYECAAGEADARLIPAPIS